MRIYEKTGSYVFLPIVFILIIGLEPVSGADNASKGAAPLQLTLKDAVSLALKSNRNIIAAANTTRSSQYSLQAARSDFDLKYRPSANIGAAEAGELLGAGVLFEKQTHFGPRFQLTPLVSRSGESTYGLVDMSIQIPLLRGWGKTINEDAINQSAFAERTSVRSLHLAREDIVLQTITEVYGIIEQKERVRLLEEQVRVMEVHTETARMKKRVELATAMDVYRALLRLQDVQDSLSTAKSRLSESRNRLKRIIAVPMDQPIEVRTTYRYQPVSVSLDAAIDQALKNRSEIDQARDAQSEAERRVTVAEHNLKPELNLRFDYERLAEDADFGFSIDEPEDRWQINLVSSTDWARAREKANYRKRLLDLENLRLRLQSLRDQIISEVRNQFEILESEQARIRIKKEQIRQARGKQKLSRVKFNHSMADNFDLIEAEAELFQARAGLLRVKTAYIINKYRLKAVMGKLLNQRGNLEFAL